MIDTVHQGTEEAIRCTGCGGACRSWLYDEDRYVDVPPDPGDVGWGRRREIRRVHKVSCEPCGWAHEQGTAWRRA